MPDQAITNFMPDPDGGSTTEPRFGVFGTSWSGGGSAYGSLTSDVTGSDWHLSGTISDYSGFGLYFDNVNNAMCNKINASAFKGIQFTIWGTVPSAITMGVPIVADAPPGTWLKSVNATGVTGNEPGRCLPGASMTQYYHPDCADPIYSFTVTGTQAAPQTVSVMWSSFTGGNARPSVMPSEITGMYWYMTWAGAASTPYAVDFHIDNLAFIPKYARLHDACFAFLGRPPRLVCPGRRARREHGGLHVPALPRSRGGRAEHAGDGERRAGRPRGVGHPPRHLGRRRRRYERAELGLVRQEGRVRGQGRH